MLVRFRNSRHFIQGFVTTPYPGDWILGQHILLTGIKAAGRVVAVGREGFTMTVDVR